MGDWKEMGTHKKLHKKPWIIAGLVLAALVLPLLFLSRTPRGRVLFSVLHFTEKTMKSEAYLLHDVDIMEFFSEYANSDTQIKGEIGLDKLKDIKASMSIATEGIRSYEKKELGMNSEVKILWFSAGALEFYAKDDTAYIVAPMLGEFGYAFPTGKDLFPRMPELTSDISQRWIRSNYGNIVKLMTEISVEKTGKTIQDEDGLVSDELWITIPKGSGHFIWELLGMKDPDYDVEISLYLNKWNHFRQMKVSLEEVLKGASITLDGRNADCFLFQYELPDQERMELMLVRNPNYAYWMDASLTYETNVKKTYLMTSDIIWKYLDNGMQLDIKNMQTTCNGNTIAQGYFKGSVMKLEKAEDVLQGKETQLDSLEKIDWRTLREDTDEFVQGIITKLKEKSISLW